MACDNPGDWRLPLPSQCRDTQTPGTEQQAAAAADMIFSLRRSRKELITGDAGENVFGGGLKDALEALDAKEQAYLELFLGKKVVTTYTHRVVIPMSSSSQTRRDHTQLKN